MIQIENIRFGYEKKKEAISGISLSLSAGHIHGLLGCNGVGKTTLMKIIAGLIRVKDGTLRVGGYEPYRRQPSFLQKMCLVTEEFDLPGIAFKEFARCNSVFYPSFSQEQLEHYAAEFGVDPEKRLSNLSMGERKKAYISFVLACQPDYLFMDEPTNGLDLPSKSVFKSLLASFITPEKTVVISTHQVTDIQNLVDNIVIMDKEGIVLNETVDRIGRIFHFGNVEDKEAAICYKETLTGVTGISANTGGRETTPDLEMLFSASLKNREQIIHCVNS